VLLCALFLSAALLGAALLAVANFYVVNSAKYYIIQPSDTEALDADCILVLGCLVRSDGSPSDMLSDRLEIGVELYEAGVAPKLLMSGDHGKVEYNEVGAMKKYATDNGVPSADVFMDHAGFSTYESMYRAKEIFGADKIIIVSQSYHLYRAIYIARSLGIEAYGVASDQHSYRGQIVRDAREAAARAKDLVYTFLRPLPTYLGDSISLLGDGNVTEG
jgi:vancomycin permeability regulator SanA